MPGSEGIQNAVTAESLAAFHRALSTATTADEAFAAIDVAMSTLLPIRGMVQIERAGSGMGVLVSIAFDPGRQPRTIHNACSGADELLPVSDTALLAELDHEPKLLRRRDAGRFGFDAEASAAVVCPIYRSGEPHAWVLLFVAEEDAELPGLVESALSIANMFDRAAEALVDRERADRAVELYEAQLAELGRVQQALLPGAPSPAGLEIATDYRASAHAGGDMYDFIQFERVSSEGVASQSTQEVPAFGAMIADVSGHGAAAAAVMAMLSTVLRSHRRQNIKPEDTVAAANNCLLDSGLSSMFATACFNLFFEDGLFEYVRCGHNPARLYRAESRTIESLGGAACLPLGIVADLEIEVESLRLELGDTLVLYTDGITEAFDAHNEMYGTDRLDRVIQAHAASGPRALVDAINADLKAFSGGAVPTDDRTMVVIRRTRDA